METKICSATYLERSVLGLGKSLNDNAGEDFAERYNDCPTKKWNHQKSGNIITDQNKIKLNK